MKRMLVLSLLVALLGGCVVVPYGYRDRDDYYRGHRHYYGQGRDTAITTASTAVEG